MNKQFDKARAIVGFSLVLALMIPQLGSADTTSGENTSGTKKQVSLSSKAITLLEIQKAEKESKRIPIQIRNQAKCIIVFPSVVKAGLFIGAGTGQGLASCRNKDTHAWGAPVYVNIEAASVGLSAGISKASIILVLLDDLAVKEFLNPDVKLGAKAEIAAGPVGRVADLSKQPSVVSYVRTKGLFAGLDMEQSAVYVVKEANEEVYGADMKSNTILYTANVPPRFKLFREALSDFAPAPK